MAAVSGLRETRSCEMGLANAGTRRWTRLTKDRSSHLLLTGREVDVGLVLGQNDAAQWWGLDTTGGNVVGHRPVLPQRRRFVPCGHSMCTFMFPDIDARTY